MKKTNGVNSTIRRFSTHGVLKQGKPLDQISAIISVILYLTPPNFLFLLFLYPGKQKGCNLSIKKIKRIFIFYVTFCTKSFFTF